MGAITQLLRDIENQSIEVSSKANPDQCMDLAYLCVMARGIPKETISQLYAKDVFLKPKTITYRYFDIIPNTPTGIPQHGDLVVFGTAVGKAGHICIATGEGNVSYFRSMDQNWNGLKKCVYVKHNYKGVLGWLTPK